MVNRTARFLRTRLIALTLLATINGCGMPTSDGETDAYLENGQLWAYGSVQLTDLGGPGTLMLRRTAGVQSVDTKWELFGAMLAGDERDLAYVDFHPVNERLLAYAYQLNVVPRNSYGALFDVFAQLKRRGRSYDQQQVVYLGTADMSGGETATMTPAPQLKMSLIANGVFAGQWAMHYANAQHITIKPWQGMCNQVPMATPDQGVPGQTPGQNPGQNPGQFDTCRPLPPEKDLCGGDPTKEGCRPLPPGTTPNDGGSAEEQPARPDRSGGALEHQGNDVYVMNADVRQAKLLFSSGSATVADDTANAEFCTRKFYAVARTANGRVNNACILLPAPATTVDGKATCGLTVRFENALTYLERICDVTVVFKGDGGVSETHKVQVLKR